MKKTKYILLKPEDFISINIEEIEKEWKRINDVPTSGWSVIERNLSMINDEALPYTLRTYLLNNLPYCVVMILQKTN